MFPDVEDASIDFIFVDVIDQTFNETRRLRELREAQNAQVLSLDILVAADVFPGELDNLNFQWALETFFDLNFDLFLSRLKSALNFFQPAKAQQSESDFNVGGSNGEQEAGGSFFTWPLICGLGVATVAAIAIVALLVRRREEFLDEERLSAQISGSYSGEDPFYSGIRPREYDQGDLPANPSAVSDQSCSR